MNVCSRSVFPFGETDRLGVRREQPRLQKANNCVKNAREWSFAVAEGGPQYSTMCIVIEDVEKYKQDVAVFHMAGRSGISSTRAATKPNPPSREAMQRPRRGHG